jgi:hypothetical protein
MDHQERIIEMITMTNKQTEDIITLVNKNTPISRGIITGFLQQLLEEQPVNKVHRVDAAMTAEINWPSSDRS